MALPKLNTPTYELERPSTGKKIKYRPFLVREQKILMVAQESNEEAQIANAMRKGCGATCQSSNAWLNVKRRT